MNNVLRLLATAAALSLPLALDAAGVAPGGAVVELHSCQLYTGGCTASSEATSAGRSLLRVWRFDAGALGDVELAGLSVAALQVGDANFAYADTAPRQMVVYVPAGASDAQAAALAAWVREQEPLARDLAVQRAAFRVSGTGNDVQVRIGGAIAFETAAMPPHNLRSCGEQLWYEPRSTTAAYTVLENVRSDVNEPALQLRWQDHDKPSVFVGRFGESAALARAQLAAAELCGVALR